MFIIGNDNQNDAEKANNNVEKNLDIRFNVKNHKLKSRLKNNSISLKGYRLDQNLRWYIYKCKTKKNDLVTQD